MMSRPRLIAFVLSLLALISQGKAAGLIPLSSQVITHFAIREERGIDETQPVVDEFAPLLAFTLAKRDPETRVPPRHAGWGRAAFHLERPVCVSPIFNSTD